MVEKIQFSDIRIEKITEDDLNKLSSFSCGNNLLDSFFHKEVVVCDQCHMFSAYCVKYNNAIIAAFTLANDSLFLESDDKDDMASAFSNNKSMTNDRIYKDYFGKSNSFPAINIGHLAVRTDYQSKGVGEYIIRYLRYRFANYNVSGCLFITVDSLNNSRTNKFYDRNGFLFQTSKDINSETRRMYFPINLYREIS
ncbi:MAG: GNAT family N-acetyltransferase [Bacteroidales bacterium]|nr:GNAT family N-acetyltransferase [Bacteroidales bacterium]MBR4137496.1 GNAT family N-acetyltransferase [Bacteroidales bacterium]